MKKIISLILVVVAVLSMTSCGSSTHSSTTALTPTLEMRMSDLQFLGEADISCEYTTYLGLFKRINKVNGEDYIPGNDVTVSKGSGLINALTSSLKGKGMNLAAAKVLNKYPDATYLQVVIDTKKVDRMFLGSVTTRTARVRAYKFKN